MGEEVKLLQKWSSPFSLRVVWALKLKGIEYETIEEDLSNKSPLLLQSNPVYKKIPVLIHNGKPLCESLVIIEYIDETWKQYPLLPQDPHDRAKARFWATFGDDKVLARMWSSFTSQGPEQEEALAAATENLKFLEEELQGKKFFGGDKIGFVDLALGWLTNMLGAMEEVNGIKIVDEQRFPRLSGWLQDFSGVPIIKENFPPHDKLVTRFRIFREKFISAAAASK
ncbi:glutathione transferase GST 23-like [Carica papaya]|uniref:glutathione transferase GST 23-like n=1 Tax=Carica papaya TaxID=3649 RepID=UPI000B8CA65C|nr:glutathione transferase GST 23-like [Carica papaya]